MLNHLRAPRYISVATLYPTCEKWAAVKFCCTCLCWQSTLIYLRLFWIYFCPVHVVLHVSSLTWCQLFTHSWSHWNEVTSWWAVTLCFTLEKPFLKETKTPTNMNCSPSCEKVPHCLDCRYSKYSWSGLPSAQVCNYVAGLSDLQLQHLTAN